MGAVRGFLWVVKTRAGIQQVLRGEEGRRDRGILSVLQMRNASGHINRAMSFTYARHLGSWWGWDGVAAPGQVINFSSPATP